MKKKNVVKRNIGVCICFCYVMNVVAQNVNAESRKLDFGAELTSELQVANTGMFNFANLLRLQASVPFNGALSWDVSSISTYMTSKESIGGDLQAFSNVDAGNIPFALAVCGLNWEINSSNALFLGIRNMNEDYFSSPVTSLFTNSSCGIYPTISANSQIANYPMASVGAHYRYEKTFDSAEVDVKDALVVQASLYNGMGYNHFTGRENVFRFCPKSDGIFGIAQVEYRRKGSGYFLGGWTSPSPSDDGGLHTVIGGWAYAEQQVTDNLSLIAAYSHAVGSFVTCSDFAGLGGKFSWGKCEAGVFTDYAMFTEGAELATELTCKMQVTPNVYIQPTFHMSSTPSVSPEARRAFCVMGTLRFGWCISM